MTRIRPASLLLGMLLVSCGGEGPARGGASDTMDPAGSSGPSSGLQGTVVFYNVENLFDTREDPGINDRDFTPKGRLAWNMTRYERKLERLSDAISWSGAQLPMMIGLAEVENRSVVEDLARTGRLASGGYEVVHFDSPDERGIDVALLVREASVRHAEPLLVDLGHDRTRDILHATVVVGDEVWHVFVNHWPSRREGPAISAPKRMKAARVLRDAVSALPKGERILIMGDLNDTPMDASIREGLGAVCLPSGELVDLMCLDVPEGHGSHNYKGEWAYLDQFIVDRATVERVARAGAVRDERLMFRHPRYGLSPDKTYSGTSYKGGFSDHLPIVLELNGLSSRR